MKSSGNAPLHFMAPSFQALRYQRLGHPALFSSTDPGLLKLLASVLSIYVDRLTLVDHPAPAGWDRNDAERLSQKLACQCSTNALALVEPSAKQLKQLQQDGLPVHSARLELVLAALESERCLTGCHETAQAMTALSVGLRSQLLVLVRTN